MPRKEPARQPKKPARATRPRAQSGGVAVAGDAHCADLVGRDKVTVTFGYSAEEVERLIGKVLTYLQAGAAFLPAGPQNAALRAELDGESLTFRPNATQTLAGCRSERAYLLSLLVRRDYQIWATKFIPLAAQADVRRAITDIPVAYSAFRAAREDAGPEGRLTTEPLADITEALDRHAAFIILGDPGAGKTTTLQKIAFEQARACLADPRAPGRVPVFARLSQQKGRPPFEFLRADWEARTGADLADALALGRVLLLADGVNELPRAERAERLKDWRLFAEEYAGANQIVFTGRERDYDAELNLPRVRVDPLDDARILDYLKRNGAEGLEALLDDPRTRLREMARNPFNLSLLVYAYQSNQREMANRGALLGWFAGELFAREERLAHPGWLHRDVQTQALAQLAYAMQARGEGTTLTEKEARVLVPATVDSQGEDVAVRPADLWRFARAATLLDPAVGRDVRFYHHLLQEYFAALELLRRFNAGDDLGALWRAPRRAAEMPPAGVGEWDALPEPPATGWEVTTILACGLVADPAGLVEVVRAHNPSLAGRCLDEAGIPRPEAAAEKVRRDLLADLYNPDLHLRTRLQAGFTLGRLGDPRFQAQTINSVKVILPEMVPVPAGTYVIGSREDEPDSYDDEKPRHTVDLPAFAIGKWPVTNAEFACFMDAGGYKDEQWWETDLAKRWLQGEAVTGGPMTAYKALWQFTQSEPDWREQLEQSRLYSPDQIKAIDTIASMSESKLMEMVSGGLQNKSREQPAFWEDFDRNNPSQPVVGITWFEARAYCAWLSAMTGRPFRLPTEFEWEAAARGATGRRYPWGDDWDAARANTLEGRVLKPSPVGAYAAAGGVGPAGAEDQAGNVWEWTTSLYTPNYQSIAPEDLGAEGERVCRGGSWVDDRQYARCAYRDRNVPDYFFSNVGFRVCSPVS